MFWSITWRGSCFTLYSYSWSINFYIAFLISQFGGKTGFLWQFFPECQSIEASIFHRVVVLPGFFGKISDALIRTLNSIYNGIIVFWAYLNFSFHCALHDIKSKRKIPLPSACIMFSSTFVTLISLIYASAHRQVRYICYLFVSLVLLSSIGMYLDIRNQLTLNEPLSPLFVYPLPVGFSWKWDHGFVLIPLMLSANCLKMHVGLYSRKRWNLLSSKSFCCTSTDIVVCL